jgi:TRAP-type C4-dicarboxylate transport system permease small subunit
VTGAPPAKPGAVAGSFALTRSLIIPRHRHLKWRALDPLEAGLMILCGVCIGGFSLCVFLDVLTRTIGHPWLWLQQATTAFFAWGVFVGMAAATRRNDHIYLAEITKRMRGTKRTVIETFNRLVVSAVAAFMVWYGLKNAILDLGSFRMPWLIPLTVYTGIVPIAGVFIVLFNVEQIVNGIGGGYEGPEDMELHDPEPTQ